MDAWSERVAPAVRGRRLALGLTQAEAVARAGRGVSIAVWSILENGRQEKYAPRTLIAISRALEWPVFAIDDLLRGAPPEKYIEWTPRPADEMIRRLGEDDDEPTPPGGAAATAIELQLAAMQERIDQLEETVRALQDPERRRSRPSPPPEED